MLQSGLMAKGLAKVSVLLTPDQFAQVKTLALELGITRTDLIAAWVLEGGHAPSLPENDRGRTVKVGVFLSPKAHTAARVSASRAGKSLSRFIADLVTARLAEIKLAA